MTTVWNLLKGIFASIQLVDVLDILILTYLIYQLILLAQRTRAVQLIRGIIVLLVCYTVAQYFGFKTLNFVFSNVLQFGIIAAIVVFQPELRRMLENVGRKTGTLPFFGQHRTGEESAAMWSEAINDICASVEAMSMDKTGALIAIELKTGLSEIARPVLPSMPACQASCLKRFSMRAARCTTAPSLYGTGASMRPAAICRFPPTPR